MIVGAGLTISLGVMLYSSFSWQDSESIDVLKGREAWMLLEVVSERVI